MLSIARQCSAFPRQTGPESVTPVLTPEFRGLVRHANPLRGFRPDYDVSARVRERAESDIVVALAGPEAQRRHSPRSWRSYHGDSDFKHAVDLAMRFNSSDEAANAYLDRLAIVTRDEIARHCHTNPFLLVITYLWGGTGFNDSNSLAD